MGVRTDWGDFPNTIIDRKLGEATSHPFYLSAKSGNIENAFYLAKDLISQEALFNLKNLIGGRQVVFAPVHAEEQAGRNMIPIAVATILARHFEMNVDLNIVQAVKVSRTGSDGWYRLANSPIFNGWIDDEFVIMVDDTQTQGGTFASFKGHIEQSGSKVIGSYALTGKQYSVQLRLDKLTLEQLRGKYGDIENWWRQVFDYDFTKLTEWEARFILNSGKTSQQVRDRILASKQG